ncbi:esterase/lipase [Candidatus Photodesmus katoptron]|uniref:alpha/beta fold hydrolase n=1 Tax=Candidatus Photodesmus anomalopis TaxID=28176 RepID=UPI0004DA8B42|nr:alpha/beta fold hydrolase [Candidatus Photodesmus katoptron]KEY90609.1 esterase/lipase [Candidatus Photodesmus katoptron]
MSKLLNYKLEGKRTSSVILLLHGLFGNLDNLGILSRNFKQHYQTLSVDLRNHGLSFHSNIHNYEIMAKDVVTLLMHLDFDHIHIIGHSMGGKVAMKVATLIEKKISTLIILDISPVQYFRKQDDNMLKGLLLIKQQKLDNRSKALKVLAEYIKEQSIRQFFNKSLYLNNKGIICWRFNIDAINNNYESILGWKSISLISIPTIFIKGANSDYILPKHKENIQKQLSNSEIHSISNTGHWLHVENPIQIIKIIQKFIKKNS